MVDCVFDIRSTVLPGLEYLDVVVTQKSRKLGDGKSRDSVAFVGLVVSGGGASEVGRDKSS